MTDARDRPSEASDMGIREASMPVKQYNIASIRSLLKDAFTADDLWRFCQARPDFRPALDRFERNPSLTRMIDILTEYCRTRSLFPELLSEIRAYNPRQYQRHSQYLYKEAAPEDEASMVAGSQGSPPRGDQNIRFEGPVYANDVIVAQGDVHVTKGAPPSSTETSDPDRGLVRLMAAVVGIAGLVAAVIWLQKAVPGLTPEFLIPLFVIIAAVVLGALGILKPDQIAAILMGWRDGAEK